MKNEVKKEVIVKSDDDFDDDEDDDGGNVPSMQDMLKSESRLIIFNN